MHGGNSRIRFFFCIFLYAFLAPSPPFRQAAGQGHPHSSFNLALGALRNMTAALEEGEVEKLLGVAAAHGLQEAQELLENILKSRNLP